MSSHQPAVIGFFDSFGLGSKYVLATVGLLCIGYIFLNIIDTSSAIFGYILATAPIWLPVTTFLLFFEYWLEYVRLEFDLAYGRTTIEIRLPQEILKSPEAMELVLTQLHQKASPDNHKETYIDGKHPPTSSLELVSRGGDVRFYMNVPRKRYKDLWEAQLYAHYPGIEVHQLDIDYTAEVPFDLKRFNYFSLHFGLKEPDAYPIKTYIEFGLDKMPKEEEKIDPINTMLEMLGSIGKKEFMWVQILISANKKSGFKEGSLTAQSDWKDDARAEIQNIIKKAAQRVGVEEVDQGKNVNQFLSDGEKETIKAIERSLGKNAFETHIRGMYICPADEVRIGDLVPRLITAWKAFDDLNRNSFSIKWRTDFDWNWWQDPSGKRRAHMKADELDSYKRRMLHPQASTYGASILTTEELATLFHFPGKVTTTPTLGRIPSKRSEAPSNLPTG